MNAFIVEDSELILKLLLRTLKAVPNLMVVGHAASEADAIREMAAQPVDLVILDIKLSPGNGLEVLKAIRQENKQCVVMVLSNETHERYRQQSFSLGANGFYDKTIELQSMVEAVKALCSKNQPG
jgi:DNA-binding NarL/FixJ family response regulator